MRQIIKILAVTIYSFFSILLSTHAPSAYAQKVEREVLKNLLYKYKGLEEAREKEAKPKYLRYDESKYRGLKQALARIELSQKKKETRLKYDKSKYKSRKRPRKRKKRKSASRKPAKKFETKFSLTIKESYSDNAYSSAKRKGDLYDTVSGNMQFKYKLNKAFGARLSLNSSRSNYHEFTDYSYMNNAINGYIEYYPLETLRIQQGYNLGFLTYLKNENSSYFSEGPFMKLRKYITPRSYLGCDYSFKVYDYDKKKIRDGEKRTLAFTREEHRHRVAGEFGQLYGKIFFRVQGTYTYNDSNDGYMDYYDYHSNKISSLVKYPFSEKADLLLDASFRRKCWKTRKVKNSDHRKQRDNLIILGSNISYHLTHFTDIKIGYKHTQNYSNNQSSRYSRGTSSVQLRASF